MKGSVEDDPISLALDRAAQLSQLQEHRGLGFDPDYEQWWEDYKRVVTELHRERYAILPVEFDGQEFESHCKQNGIVPDQEALRRYTRLRATEFAE